MVVLALDTVTRAGSLALASGSRVRVAEGDPARTHGQRLPAEILELLAAEGLAARDVDVFAVVSGPGSFTGLRVGIATIQAMALAADRRVVPVPTLEAMVAAWQGDRAAPPAIVVPCLDGQRGDVFFAAYHAGGSVGPVGWPVRLAPDVATPEEAARVITARMQGDGVVLVGSGVEKHAPAFRSVPNARIESMAMPLAAAAVRIAIARKGHAVRPHALQPVYIRRPDAVIARERARQPSRGRVPAPLDDFVVEPVMSAADLEAVEALQQTAFARQWAAGSFQWELEHSRVARVYVMRTPGGEVVAYCACWLLADELHINSLAVAEGWRRRGLARRLFTRVARHARAEGATSATLEVRVSNHAARALYEGLGFLVEGVRRDYYQAPREDAIILWHRSLETAV